MTGLEARCGGWWRAFFLQFDWGEYCVVIIPISSYVHTRKNVPYVCMVTLVDIWIKCLWKDRTSGKRVLLRIHDQGNLINAHWLCVIISPDMAGPCETVKEFLGHAVRSNYDTMERHDNCCSLLICYFSPDDGGYLFVMSSRLLIDQVQLVTDCREQENYHGTMELVPSFQYHARIDARAAWYLLRENVTIRRRRKHRR